MVRRIINLFKAIDGAIAKVLCLIYSGIFCTFGGIVCGLFLLKSAEETNPGITKSILNLENYQIKKSKKGGEQHERKN